MVYGNLKAEGFDVDTAGTGEEALSLLEDRRKTYDVVVLDVMLHGINGFHWLQSCAHRGSSFPFFMLTALGRSNSRENNRF